MRNKKAASAALALALLLAVTACPGFAAPGQADDPVVTKAYVDGVFRPGLEAYAQSGVLARFKAAPLAIDAVIAKAQSLKSSSAAAAVADAVAAVLNSRQVRFAKTATRVTLGYGETLAGGMGTLVTVISGSANVTGTVVDFSRGTDLTPGSEPPARHLLSLLGGTVRALSETRLSVTGYYRVVSRPRALYADLAGALNAVGLLAGTGQGYELERPATRVEALVMMIKLFGENETALAYKGTHPFTDVPAWASAYVGYAYAKKYTSGTSAVTFSPSALTTADQYATFILKALGYNSDRDFVWSSAVAYAADIGLYTNGELPLIRGDFLRDKMAYMSWYALSGKMKNGRDTLLDRLVVGGFVTEAAVKAAQAQVTRQRP